MKKILVLFTGGTIGSAVHDGIVSVDREKKYLLVDQYKSIYGRGVEFECRQILNILSENITSKEWQVIADELSGVDFNDYSGVIITHGSDTLAYTSALVGMLFRHSPVPIILTAANLPLTEKGTNGLYNFTCAVKMITDGKYRGVFTVYEEVFMSTRLLPADTCLDKFSVYGGEQFRGISEKMLEKKFPPLLKKPFKLEKRVLKIEGYPDMDFSAYRIPEGVGAVLYEPYHSATASMRENGGAMSFSYLADMCAEKGVPLYVCGVKNTPNRYDTLDKMMKCGIRTVGKISAPTAYIKLLIGINQSEYPLDEFMGMNIYFEEVF